jgi:chromosome segregation ATPase
LASQIQKLQAQQKELTDATRQLEQSIRDLKHEKIPAAQMELGNAREGVDGVLTTNKATATQGLQEAKRTLENKEQECKVASKQANDLAAKNRDTQKSQDALRAKLDAQIAVLVKQCSDAEKAQQKKVQSSEQQQRKVAQQVETTWNQLREELETVRSRQSATESLLQSLQEQLPREHEASKEAESTEKSLASEIHTAQRMLSSDQTALALLEEETADLRQELLQLQSVTEARTQAETVRAQESQAAFAKCHRGRACCKRDGEAAYR